MAANGSAILLTLEPPSVQVASGALAPAQDEPGMPIEIEIGQAAAAAAAAFCVGWQELESGDLTRATRKAGAERIYRLHELRRSLPEPGFSNAVNREGKKILRRNFDADFYSRNGAGAGEATLDQILTTLIEAVDRVAAFEREMAN